MTITRLLGIFYLSEVKKTLEEEDGYDKMADTEVFFVSTSLGEKKNSLIENCALLRL